MSVYNTTYRYLLITWCPYVTVTELVEQSYLSVLIRVVGENIINREDAPSNPVMPHELLTTDTGCHL